MVKTGVVMTRKNPENIYADLLSACKKYPAEVSFEVRNSLRKKLETVSNQKKKRIKYFRTILATAASLVLVLSIILAGYGFSTNSVDRKLVFESTVPSGKPLTIKLKYDASGDFENVKFSIDLDDGVSFFTKNSEIKNKRSHIWEGSLKKGQNIIPFVVSTEKTGKMKIKAKAEYNNFSHLQEIVLDAKETSVSVSMFSFEPVMLK